MKFDIKLITIIVLGAILLFLQFGNKGNKKGEIVNVDGKKYELLKHDIDTVEVVKTKTVVKKGKDIFHDTTIYVNLPMNIDSLAVIKSFYSKNVYKDTLSLQDSLGMIIVYDTISQNKIHARTFIAKVKERTIYDKKIVKELPKTQVYAGPLIGFNRKDYISSVGGAVILKTKKDKLYQIGAGIAVQSGEKPLFTYVNGGILWKIRIKK